MGNLNKVIESMLCLRYDIIYFKGLKKKRTSYISVEAYSTENVRYIPEGL